MAKEKVTVPDIGGAEGAEVIELLVAVGDEVSLDQGLIVLESDKASMEIPSTVAGTVVELLVSEGEELAEGAPVAVIETAGDESRESAAEAEANDEPEQAGAEPAAEAEEAPAQGEDSAADAAASGSEERKGEGGTSSALVEVPDIGTDEAVELIEIVVKVGDTVAEGDSLVVLESDKASMEVPAPHGGEITEIKVNEGDSVRQGDPLLVMATTGASEPAADAAPSAPAEAKGETDSKSSAKSDTEEKPEAEPASRPATAGREAPPAASADSAGKVYAGPAVRKLAREFGIKLAEVPGSGPRGRLVKEDLHKFVQQRLSKPAGGAAGAGLPVIPEVDFSAFGEVEITTRSKLDKLTANNMQRSWLNVPHVTQNDLADITELEAFRASMKDEAAKRGVKITPMPFILKACAVALRDNPKFCTSLADGGESLVHKQYIHIGMAVDTPAGLLVPVIRDVDKKGIWELAEEVLELAGKARDRKLSPAQMQGGCFTISSLGNIGGTGFTPIVNAPEVGILGVSRADMQPVWNGQEFVARKMLPLSLSYDHRVINGGDGGRFLTQLAALLGDIRQLLM
ncbi:dihydrolipoyllysine-residue acetyltransferase [Seongchinamella sediminis]|uniref:Acetyltransferase component of pyruvate dehydrogenase complex n=1 Tax=Seongchinamella sediminis TaxID=2283635 RepID=A0A3L7E3D2_9GAMM|nr:dihydrolipoyllysine-residue acetyltransferase [Seongchinamella sediminis]RLQ23659.1 dihydrolipoyllysine-residue acetyltransferase [Seongchinamella sediminis]